MGRCLDSLRSPQELQNDTNPWVAVLSNSVGAPWIPNNASVSFWSVARLLNYALAQQISAELTLYRTMFINKAISAVKKLRKHAMLIMSSCAICWLAIYITYHS